MLCMHLMIYYGITQIRVYIAVHTRGVNPTYPWTDTPAHRPGHSERSYPSPVAAFYTEQKRHAWSFFGGCSLFDRNHYAESRNHQSSVVEARCDFITSRISGLQSILRHYHFSLNFGRGGIGIFGSRKSGSKCGERNFVDIRKTFRRGTYNNLISIEMRRKVIAAQRLLSLKCRYPTAGSVHLQFLRRRYRSRIFQWLIRFPLPQWNRNENILWHKHFFTSILLHCNPFPSYWHPLPMWYSTEKQMQTQSSSWLDKRLHFPFLKKGAMPSTQIVRPPTTAP